MKDSSPKFDDLDLTDAGRIPTERRKQSTSRDHSNSGRRGNVPPPPVIPQPQTPGRERLPETRRPPAPSAQKPTKSLVGQQIKAQPAKAERRARGSVTAVLGAKGGCGTTMVAVHMAALLSMRLPTCLLDFDFSSSDATASLSLKLPRSMKDLMGDIDRLDHNMFRGFANDVDENLSLLGQPEDPAEREVIGGEAALSIMRASSEAFARVVVDGGAHLDESWLVAASSADQVFMVCTQDVLAVRNAHRRLRLLDRLGVDRGRIGLVVNRWHKKALIGVQDMEENLGIPIVAQIANDERNCQKARMQGKLLHEVVRRSPANAGLRHLAEYVDHRTAFLVADQRLLSRVESTEVFYTSGGGKKQA